MLNRVSGYLQLNIGQDFLLQEFVLQDIIMPVKQYYNQDIGKVSHYKNLNLTVI